jgi:hypothetical protein
MSETLEPLRGDGKYVTEQNFEDTLQKFTQKVVDEMDIDDLMSAVQFYMETIYRNHYSRKELETEIIDQYGEDFFNE